MTRVVYHWAPVDRRRSIAADGLRPFMSVTFHHDEGQGHAAPYLCFAASPSAAWSLSIGTVESSGIERWDLWQVELPHGADVRPLPYFEGRNTPEIRTYSSIPADHLWLVGTREPEAFEPVSGPEAKCPRCHGRRKVDYGEMCEGTWSEGPCPLCSESGASQEPGS